MNGKRTKFYRYKSSTSATVTIPVSLAEGLGWEHKDEIYVTFEVIEGEKGLFLFKKKDSDKKN